MNIMEIKFLEEEATSKLPAQSNRGLGVRNREAQENDLNDHENTT